MDQNTQKPGVLGAGMTNILIEHIRKNKKNHFFCKKFVPVFERTFSDGGPLWDQLMYVRGAWNFYSTPTPTSVPKKLWPLVRVRRQRQGQLNLGLL